MKNDLFYGNDLFYDFVALCGLSAFILYFLSKMQLKSGEEE